ncbi:MAG: hypothetical protein KBB75_01500 [Candidatus Pacebacteria bacterium]|jgi:hypothetical protein|nr:hypothetical protein [Candidatus Paceibacterota bacterium]
MTQQHNLSTRIEKSLFSGKGVFAFGQAISGDSEIAMNHLRMISYDPLRNTPDHLAHTLIVYFTMCRIAQSKQLERQKSENLSKEVFSLFMTLSANFEEYVFGVKSKTVAGNQAVMNSFLALTEKLAPYRLNPQRLVTKSIKDIRSLIDVWKNNPEEVEKIVAHDAYDVIVYSLNHVCDEIEEWFISHSEYAVSQVPMPSAH